MRVPKSEDEHLELVGAAAETHSGLRKIAFKLRRELPAKAPSLKEALKAEETSFRLKRELQLLDITDPEPAERRGPWISTTGESSSASATRRSTYRGYKGGSDIG